MKYLITENRLNDIIFKYLNAKLDGIEQKEGSILNIVFVFPNEDYGMLGYNRTGDLVIRYKFAKEISDFFGIEYDDSKMIIGKWVQDRFDKKVTNIYATTDLNILKVARY